MIYNTKYYKIRDKIKLADVIMYSHGKSIVSKLIRLITRSPFTHCSIVLEIPDKWGLEHRKVVIEALPRGLTINYLSQSVVRYDGNVWLYKLKANEKQRMLAAGWLWDKLCKITDYDWKSIFRMAISKVSTDSAKLICSETVQMALEYAKILPCSNKILTPGELSCLLIKHCNCDILQIK